MVRERGVGDEVGLVEDDEVGGDQLVLEQFAERGFVIEHVVGRAQRIDGGFVIGKAAFAERGGIGDGDDAIDGDLGLDLGPVEGADQRLRQGEAGGLDDDVVGPVGAGQQRLHGGDELVGDGAADAAVAQLDHVLLAAGLVAAAGEDVLVDAEFAELVDDERDALALGVGEQVADQRGLAGAEEAGDDGDGDLFAHACAPLRAVLADWAKRSLSQPRAGRAMSQNTRTDGEGWAANSVARWAGTLPACSPASGGAPMTCGSEQQHGRDADAGPVAEAWRSPGGRRRWRARCATHQTWRATRSAAGMPGSSGAQAEGRGELEREEAAEAPERRHCAAVISMPLSTETAASSRAKPSGGEDVGEHGVGGALDAILRSPGVFVVVVRRRRRPSCACVAARGHGRGSARRFRRPRRRGSAARRAIAGAALMARPAASPARTAAKKIRWKSFIVSHSVGGHATRRLTPAGSAWRCGSVAGKAERMARVVRAIVDRACRWQSRRRRSERGRAAAREAPATSRCDSDRLATLTELVVDVCVFMDLHPPCG